MKKFWLGTPWLGFSLLLISMIAMSGCGGMEDPCINFSCPEGQICIDNNGTATCQVPSDGGGGSGQEGDECSTNADCAEGLTCQDTLGGTLECLPS